MLSRNAELNNWGTPTLEYGRNPIELEYNHKTTAKAGDLIPFYCNILINPGDTIKMNMSFVCRMLTPYFPVMDNAYIDIYFFSLPWLYSWEHTKQFFGEDLIAPFDTAPEYTIPIIKNDTSGTYATLAEGTILDHLGGLPIGTAFETDRLGLNTYLNVYNNWFRDQNLIAPITIDKTDADVTYDGTSATGGTLLKVAKSHDYFTSATLEPQKGVALTMPIGTEAPIYGNGKALYFNTIGSDGTTINAGNLAVGQYDYSNQLKSGAYITNGLQRNIGATTNTTTSDTYAKTNTATGIITKDWAINHTGATSGIYADISAAISATLNAQRPVLAISHIQEKMGLMGSRYKEYLKWGFGVTAPSLNLGVAEYLGGKRVPINIDTVLSTTDMNSDLGETGAYSITADADYMFTKSFDMHTVLLGVFCIRNDQTYSQGIDCQHSKRRRYDFYDNDLKGLGMQPIYNKEIMVTGTNDDLVWAYKPAFQEYRTEINHVSGKMRPNAAGSLARWTYANNFATRPSFAQTFIEQSESQIDNTLKVQNAEQFFLDINLQYLKLTEVPQWAQPGIDKF